MQSLIEFLSLDKLSAASIDGRAEGSYNYSRLQPDAFNGSVRFASQSHKARVV